MILLAIRTDNPQAELTLFDGDQQVAHHEWQAHRQLAETLHSTIKSFLSDNGKELSSLDGIAGYLGPGSFTGLRIGLSVANALAASYALPIAGAAGGDWPTKAVTTLCQGSAKKEPLVPEYGSPVHITPQRH